MIRIIINIIRDRRKKKYVKLIAEASKFFDIFVEEQLREAEQLDETLDNIRLGDNVVWQVSNLKEFSYSEEIERKIENTIKLIDIASAHIKID